MKLIFTVIFPVKMSVCEGSYLSKKGYVIRKECLSAEELTDMKQELKGRPLQDEKFNLFNKVDTTFPLYTETKNKIYIPKMYGINRFGRPAKENTNYSGTQWVWDIKFIGNLKEHQLTPVSKLLDELTSKSSGGILSLGTGLGKTFCALKVVSELKVKTLVIVNKIALLKQWEAEIKAFLPSARIGVVQGQKNVDTRDKDIVIAMLQSLARVDYPEDMIDDIGCTIVDECHNVSTKVFSTVLMKVASKYTIGLSATPQRSDGCEYVFKWYLGDIVYQQATDRRGLPPVVSVIKINSGEYKEIATVNKITGQKQIQFTSMLSELTTMTKRNKLIVEIVKDYVKREHRRVLVLSDRREHLKTIKSMLDMDTAVAFTYGLFVGQMKVTDLERSKASQVILATYQAFGEGVSEKDLDTLVLITPKKFIGHLKTTKNESGKLEQIVGRIFRKDHTERCPLIVDVQDNFSVYKNQSRQRMAFYKQHFPSVSFKEHSINLDKFEIANIDVSSMIASKKNAETSFDHALDEATQNLYTQCMLD